MTRHGKGPRGFEFSVPTINALFTDTTDTVLHESGANWRDYRDSSLRSNSLVTRTNAGYYREAVGFTVTCR